MRHSILALIALVTTSCGPTCVKAHDVVVHSYHSESKSATNHYVHDEYSTVHVCDAWEAK